MIVDTITIITLIATDMTILRQKQKKNYTTEILFQLYPSHITQYSIDIMQKYNAIKNLNIKTLMCSTLQTLHSQFWYGAMIFPCEVM